MSIALRMLVLTALAVTPAGLARSQDATGAQPPTQEKPAPYDDQLARLSEILGAMHYLRNLCTDRGEPEWRSTVQKLLDTETANEAARRARMVAAFNRGYRSFAAIHSECTTAAIAAEEQYRAEGATLIAEIATRYGN
jgi:TIGR02301 family protein